MRHFSFAEPGTGCQTFDLHSASRGRLFIPCGGIFGSMGQAIVMDVVSATDGMILAVSLN